MPAECFLSSITDKESIVTAIDNAPRFPEILTIQQNKYADSISLFKTLVARASSSAELLETIRGPSIKKDDRMSLLKMFRRCVSPVIDTEKAKKIKAIKTESLVSNYGHTFKSIEVLQRQMADLDDLSTAALASLIGEYDTRGQSGYELTLRFFNWFNQRFDDEFSIEGPVGAGRDIELSSIFTDYKGSFPCDFVIRRLSDGNVVAVGFARYDSTRGGAQSDDRTGGNSNKVDKAIEFCRATDNLFKILFVSDGPGLTHNDTWQEACELDGAWDGNSRVTTLKTADIRVTSDWLNSN